MSPTTERRPRHDVEEIPGLDELVEASKVSVFFIDDHQAVRPGEVTAAGGGAGAGAGVACGASAAGASEPWKNFFIVSARTACQWDRCRRRQAAPPWARHPHIG